MKKKTCNIARITWITANTVPTSAKRWCQRPLINHLCFFPRNTAATAEKINNAANSPIQTIILYPKINTRYSLFPPWYFSVLRCATPWPPAPPGPLPPTPQMLVPNWAQTQMLKLVPADWSNQEQQRRAAEHNNHHSLCSANPA